MPTKFFYLTVVSFFVVVTSSLLGGFRVKESSRLQSVVEKETIPVATKVLPVITGDVAFPILSAQAVLATDVDSGVNLFEKNPDGRLFPASTTKIITFLVAKDAFELNQVISVKDFDVEGQKMDLLPGEKIRVSDLLYGLLVYSANDAAEVLAMSYPGGRERFVEAMNIKAAQIGLGNGSSFKNPTGLDEDGHMTTARDLGVAAKYAMQNDFFRTIVATKEKEVKSVDGRIVHRLANVNKLLGEVDGVLGVKTGWTENARENLVTYVQKDGKTVSIVLLGSQDRFGETTELINWIFDNYLWRPVQISSN